MGRAVDHASRKHSFLSASGASRWLACTPSPLLEKQFPDTTSELAAEGTLAHELAELKLQNYFDSVNFGKRKLTAAVKKLKENPLWSEEMTRHTDDYLDYVRAISMQRGVTFSSRIEKEVYFGKYTLADTADENEGYGTPDCVLIGGGTIHVIDFKYGQSPNGRVSAEGNPQLSLYALGIYETYKILYQISRVELHIFQPRLPDGISEWGCNIEELLAWGGYVRKKAALARKGEGEYAPSPKTCKYCRARGKCRARAEENVKLAFSDSLGKLPPLITNEEMGEFLRQGTDVAKWLSDLQNCALKECLAGNDVPGWKVVEGRGSRDWTDMDKAFETLKASGIEEAILWERKPLTLAQVEKAVGKKDFNDSVGEYVVKKPGKPALVEASDKRPAITNKVTAAEAFKGENGSGQ